MSDVGSRTIVSLFAIALLIAVAGTTISVTKLAELSETGSFLSFGDILSGAATGTTNLSIEGTATINVAINGLDFGGGYYDTTCDTSIATINTTITDVTDGELTTSINYTCWINSSTLNASYGHLIINNGTSTVNLNVSTNTTDAEMFYCGTAQGCAGSTDALVEVAMLVGELSLAASCSGTANSSLVPILGNDSNGSTNYQICSIFEAEDSRDELGIDFKLTIPSDATNGDKTLMITYTATQN